MLEEESLGQVSSSRCVAPTVMPNIAEGIVPEVPVTRRVLCLNFTTIQLTPMASASSSKGKGANGASSTEAYELPW